MGFATIVRMSIRLARFTRPGVLSAILFAAACSGDGRSAVLALVEDASKKVAESDAYMNDIDRGIEKLIAMKNWDMGESSYVQQEREKIRIEHDELMSRCLGLKFEAGEKKSAEAVVPLTDKAKDALARSQRHLAKAREFRNALQAFQSWTERLSANIAVCQTYLNQMYANVQSLAKTKEGASSELREKITLFEARYGALKRGENEATGLARQTLKQYFTNSGVAEAGSKAALDKLMKLQEEIRGALMELQPFLLEATPKPEFTEEGEPK
jgi:hypothetical protein